MIRPVLTLISSEIVARGLQALAFVLMTRHFTTDALGRFGLSSSLLAYLLLVLLPALDLVAVRKAARGELPLGETVRGIIRLRLVLAGLAVLLALAWGLLWQRDWLLPILSLTALAAAFNAKWALQAVEETANLGAAAVISQAVFLAGVVLAPAGRLGWIALAQVAGEALAAWWSWHALRRAGHVLTRLGAPSAPAPRELRRALLTEAWPLQWSMLLGVMMYNFDVLMLGWFGLRSDIAFYLAAYRFITVFSPLFAAIQTAIYPRFARAFPDASRVRGEAAWLTAVLGGGCLLVALALTFFGRTALSLLYGETYASADRILSVMALVLPLQAVRVVLRQLALAWHLQASDPWRVLAAVSVNVLGDLALIPLFGALGAAWSTLAAEATLLFLFAWAVWRRL